MSQEGIQKVPSEITAIRELDLTQIQRLIPHRPPMLLIEKLSNVRFDEGAIGFMKVHGDEWFLQGHFPKKAIMPGVMIVEALAQTAAALAMHTLGLYDNENLVYFLGIDETRFRKMVVPNDELQLEVIKIHRRGPVWKFKGIAKVADEVVAETVMTAMIADK